MPFVYAAIFLVSYLLVARKLQRSSAAVQPDQPTVPDVEDGKKLVRFYGTVWNDNPTECAMKMVGTEAIKK